MARSRTITEDRWGASAWRVTRPTPAFQRLGWSGQTQTFYGSSQLLATVYQRVTLRRGDVVLALPGGTFALRRGEKVAHEVAFSVSDKHPFEKTFGMRVPFAEAWAGQLHLKRLREVPQVPLDRGDKEVAVPPGTSRHGRNIDFVLPEG